MHLVEWQCVQAYRGYTKPRESRSCAGRKQQVMMQHSPCHSQQLTLDLDCLPMLKVAAHMKKYKSQAETHGKPIWSILSHSLDSLHIDLGQKSDAQ